MLVTTIENALGMPYIELELEAIVDKPLEGGKSSDLHPPVSSRRIKITVKDISYHGYSNGEAVPEAYEANLSIDAAHGGQPTLTSYTRRSAT
jgi:hypothetical protein